MTVIYVDQIDGTRPPYPGLFKQKGYQLKGRDWLRSIPADDRKAFVSIGLRYALHGHLGGVARARSGLRDSRGRFIGKVC